MSIGGFLLNFVTGGALGTIKDGIGEWHERKLRAENAHEKLEADQEIAGLEARASVLRAEARDTINGWVRLAIASGPAAYIFSYFMIDKVLCIKLNLTVILWQSACRVDPIENDQMNWVMASVVAFYLVTEGYARRKK